MARSLLVLTAVLGLSSCLGLTQAAVNYTETVNSFRNLRDIADQIQGDANDITVLDDVLVQANQGHFQTVIDDINSLTAALGDSRKQLEGASFDTCKDGPDSIAKAFYDFTNRLNAALKALEDKAGLFSIGPALGSSVSNPLQACLRAFDEFVSAAAGLCPDSMKAFFDTRDVADEQFDTVIKTYQGGAVTQEVIPGLPSVGLITGAITGSGGLLGGLLGGGNRRLLRT